MDTATRTPLFLLATPMIWLAGCGDDGAVNAVTSDDVVDPYNYEQVVEHEFSTGGELSEEDYSAILVAPMIAGKRIDAATWNGDCPAPEAQGSDAPQSAEMRQSDAMKDAADLGDRNALFCIAGLYEDIPVELVQAEAYEALVLAGLWGAQVSPERLARLETAIGPEQTATSKVRAERRFDEVSRVLAYEREHGPIPPALGRGHTFDGGLATNPTGIGGPLPDPFASDDADDEPGAPEPDLVVP